MSEEGIIRNEKGQLVEGTASLNPGGRPKGVATYIREKYGDNLEQLIDKLSELLDTTTDDKLKTIIIREFLDRVIGKPVQTQVIESDNTITIGKPKKGEGDENRV